MAAEDALTFILHVSHERQAQLEWCLENLRRSYASARVIVIADGISHDWHSRVCAEHECEYRMGERLYGVESGALIWQRFFDFFFERPSQYVFRIDPDTYVVRRFTSLPASGIFGTWQGRNSLQGGCIGFSRDMAEVIWQSNLCTSPDFFDPNSWTHGRSPLRDRAQVERLTSMDWLLAEICNRLRLKVQHHPEINSQWRGTPSTAGHAVVHPVRIR